MPPGGPQHDTEFRALGRVGGVLELLRMRSRKVPSSLG